GWPHGTGPGGADGRRLGHARRPRGVRGGRRAFRAVIDALVAELPEDSPLGPVRAGLRLRLHRPSRRGGRAVPGGAGRRAREGRPVQGATGEDPAGRLAAEHRPPRGGCRAAAAGAGRAVRRTGRRGARLSRALPVEPGPRPRGAVPGPRGAGPASAPVSAVDGRVRARARWAGRGVTDGGQVTIRGFARSAERAVTGCRPAPLRTRGFRL